MFSRVQAPNFPIIVLKAYYIFAAVFLKNKKRRQFIEEQQGYLRIKSMEKMHFKKVSILVYQ